MVYLVGVVRVNDQGVQVSVLVGLGGDGLLDQVVLTVLAKDDMDTLGGRTADIRTEHDAGKQNAE